MAETDGIYTFDMTKVDDGAMVFIGDAAYDCCKPGSIPTGDADTAAMFSYKAWNQPSDASYVWIYFEAGSYYPIRIVYANVISAGGINLEVTAPGSSDSVNIGSLVYQLINDDSNTCSAITVTTNFESSTTYIYTTDVAKTLTFPRQLQLMAPLLLLLRSRFILPHTIKFTPVMFQALLTIHLLTFPQLLIAAKHFQPRL